MLNKKLFDVDSCFVDPATNTDVYFTDLFLSIESHYNCHNLRSVREKIASVIPSAIKKSNGISIKYWMNIVTVTHILKVELIA